MASVSARLTLSAEEAWALVTDVRNHARWVPLTRLDVAPAAGSPTTGPGAGTGLALGDTFTAVSGPGAGRGWPGLPDRMTLEHLTPPDSATGTPGRAVYRKRGPVLLGTAGVHVGPEDPSSCTVVWTEDVHLRGLPRGLTAPVLRPVLALMLRVVMRRLRAEVNARADRS